MIIQVSHSVKLCYIILHIRDACPRKIFKVQLNNITACTAKQRRQHMNLSAATNQTPPLICCNPLKTGVRQKWTPSKYLRLATPSCPTRWSKPSGGLHCTTRQDIRAKMCEYLSTNRCVPDVNSSCQNCWWCNARQIHMSLRCETRTVIHYFCLCVFASSKATRPLLCTDSSFLCRLIRRT